MSQASTRSERREAIRARLARTKEHLARNSWFALSGDEIDSLIVQQEQWEAAVAAEILDRPRFQPGPADDRPERTPDVPIDVLRPRLWRIVNDLIKDDRGDEDLEGYYGLLDLTFSWVEHNRDSMPQTEPELRDWLLTGYHVIFQASAAERWKRRSPIMGGVFDADQEGSASDPEAAPKYSWLAAKSSRPQEATAGRILAVISRS